MLRKQPRRMPGPVQRCLLLQHTEQPRILCGVVHSRPYICWATHERSRVLPGQNAPQVNSPRNVASLSAKDEPKQLKTGS